MAATTDAAAAGLPPKDSLYYDYLCSFPVGVSMSMELQPDAEALEETETAGLIFTITKAGADAWIGLPGYASEDGLISTRTLFDHIVEQMEGEDFILVSHGRDPRKVKREVIERGEELEQTIKFFSLYETIVLDSGTDSDGETPAAAPLPAGKDNYTSVRLSLALPASAPAAAPAPAPSEADAPAEAEAPAAAPKPDKEPKPAPAMPAEEPALPALPAEGAYVLIDGQAALCFKRGKAVSVVAYDDHAWEVVPANIPWEPCPEEKQCALAGVVDVLVGKQLRVEAYQYGKASFGRWTVFDEYRHPKPPAVVDEEVAAELFSPPRLPPLKSGDRVDCSGNIWSGKGNKCASGGGVVFVATAEQHVKATEEGKKPQLRRVAVVGLPSGELTWAELMGREEGCIQLCEPAARATSEELAALKAQLPTLLASRDVANVNSLLSRLVGADGGPSLRPRREPAPAALPAAADTIPPPPKEGRPPPTLPFDLKNVTVSSLRKLQEGQLLALCEERSLPLAADAGAPQMLTALLGFRARQGRSRRASGSSGGRGAGGSSVGGGVSDDGLGGDDEQEEDRRREREGEEAREREREREKKRERQEKRKEEKREKREKRKKRKKRKKRARSPSPSSGSDSDSSGSSSHHSPKRRRHSPSSDCSTPWDVVKAREERDAIEAAKLARLTAKIDRHERKKHERKHERERHR